MIEKRKFKKEKQKSLTCIPLLRATSIRIYFRMRNRFFFKKFSPEKREKKNNRNTKFERKKILSREGEGIEMGTRETLSRKERNSNEEIKKEVVNQTLKTSTTGKDKSLLKNITTALTCGVAFFYSKILLLFFQPKNKLFSSDHVKHHWAPLN